MWNVRGDSMLHCENGASHCEPVIMFTSLLANLRAGITLIPCSIVAASTRRPNMAWKAPKIVEVPVGMEINMYACAARK
jgi:coenzyme PQQ precursor peptide PqqA